jgi:hypothetical protein
MLSSFRFTPRGSETDVGQELEITRLLCSCDRVTVLIGGRGLSGGGYFFTDCEIPQGLEDLVLKAANPAALLFVAGNGLDMLGRFDVLVAPSTMSTKLFRF